MKVVLSGNERALKLLIQKERFWLSRNGITVEYDESVETKEVTTPKIKEDQLIIFDKPNIKKVGESDFELTAESSSELPIAFSSSDETIAKIEGNKVTIVKDGKINITAIQLGNEDFKEAESVIQELVIKKKGLLG